MGQFAAAPRAPRRRSPIDRAAAAVDGAQLILRAAPCLDGDLQEHVAIAQAALERAVGRIAELQDGIDHPLAIRRREIRRLVGRPRLTLVDGGRR